MPKENVYNIVDPSSGEIIDGLRDGDRILRSESYDYLTDRAKIEGGYIKIQDTAADMLSRADDLTLGGFQVMLRLIPYIRFDTGELAYTNGASINTTHIKKICEGMSDRTVTRALAVLLEQDVIGKWQREGRKNAYYVNPFIFMRGERVGKTLLNMFKNTKWAKNYFEVANKSAYAHIK